MKAPEVTVLTAVRNGERFLPDAIASIGSQTFQEWEHVIVDDASEDASVDIVESAMRHDPRIRLVRRTERGYQAAALNDGLAVARGRYILNLDADDVAAPDRIERQIAYLASNPHLRACAGGAAPLAPRYRDRGRAARTSRIPASALAWWLVVRRNLTHSTACIERDAFEAIGWYGNERAAQDLRVWCALARRGWLGVCPGVVTFTRRHEGQVSSQMSLAQRDVAIETIAEHAGAMSGSSWPKEDVAVLYMLQRCVVTPMSHGRRVLKQWRRLWLRDERLDADSRRALTKLYYTLTLRLLMLRKPIARVVCGRS